VSQHNPSFPDVSRYMTGGRREDREQRVAMESSNGQLRGSSYRTNGPAFAVHRCDRGAISADYGRDQGGATRTQVPTGFEPVSPP